MLELRPQRDGVRQLPGFDSPRDRLEDAAVDRIAEMIRHQELGYPLIGLVVGQQRAQQRLFGLMILRRQALRQAEERDLIDIVHPVILAAPGSGCTCG